MLIVCRLKEWPFDAPLMSVAERVDLLWARSVLGRHVRDTSDVASNDALTTCLDHDSMISGCQIQIL